MVRAFGLLWFLAALVQAQPTQVRNVTIYFDTNPFLIDDVGTTLAVLPTRLHPNSPLLAAGNLQRRKKIEVAAHIATIASSVETAILAAGAGLVIYDFIAKKIKAQPEQNSCSLIHGTEDNGHVIEGYAYYATTTGSNCETTAELKTIENAVAKCANVLSKNKAVRGCCNFTHGGDTWHGHLRLSSEPGMFPADQINCPI